jgi:hypothetical protein
MAVFGRLGQPCRGRVIGLQDHAQLMLSGLLGFPQTGPVAGERPDLSQQR